MKNIHGFFMLVTSLIKSHPGFKPLARFVYHTRAECPGMCTDAQSAWNFIEDGLGGRDPENAVSDKVIEIRVTLWEDISINVSLQGVNCIHEFNQVVNWLKETGQFTNQNLTFTTASQRVTPLMYTVR